MAYSGLTLTVNRGASLIIMRKSVWAIIAFVFLPSIALALPSTITSGVCNVPPGYFQQHITVTGACKIVGAGGASWIHGGIRIRTDAPVVIRDLCIEADDVGIHVSDDGDSPYGNSDSKFDNLYITGGTTGIYFEAANHWDITDCHLTNQTWANIVVDNIRNGDAGDASIQGTEMWAELSATANVIQYSSGGLKIVASKLASPALTGPRTRYGYMLDMQDRDYGGADGTAILEIVGNSFEGHKASIVLNNDSSYIWYFVSIAGNEIRDGIVVDRLDQGDNHIRYITITGNTLIGASCVDAGIAVGGGTVNITGNIIDCLGMTYGIARVGGRVWQANNVILNAVTKTWGVFEPY